MTTACIQKALGLFQTNTCEASALAAASFVLGALAACLVCKLLRPCCGRAKGAASAQKGADRPAGDRQDKRRQPPADGSVEIYVGNLSYDLSEDQLRKEFEAFGKVGSARIVTNRYTGRSKGFGFVHMPDRAAAAAAVKALNDKELLGRRLKCNEAKND